jgi:predicted nucleic acid-binding protein
MRLAIDANVLVSEALRERGRALLLNPQLDLVIAVEARSEAEHEIERRVELMRARAILTPDAADRSLASALRVLAMALSSVAPGGYSRYLNEARKRIPRDPNDAPTVAVALAFGCGIWTNDYDFFGCGVATWTTETILLQLSSAPGA